MTQGSLSFAISGLNCASCVGRAEAALQALPGAQNVRVNLADHSARIAGVDPDAAVKALAAAGYPAKVTQVRWEIPNMSCASCVGRIEAAAQALPGVLKAEARLPTHEIYADVLGDPEALRAALADAGYAPRDAVPEAAPIDSAQPLFRRFVLAALLTLPVFVMEMGGHLVPALHHWIAATIGMGTSHTIQLVLTGLVLAGPGAGFFRRGVPGLLKARPDMDALVALGAGAAFLFSALAVLAPGVLPPAGVYFEAAAVIVTLILMGRWLEARAKGHTGDAVRRLLGLRPDTAEVERDGTFADVPLSEVQVGDLLRVRPGGRIAVDGEVISGETHIDEAMLTGEPIPVFKRTGDPVSAGTLATTGSLIYRATHVGRDTVLARITALTEAAQAARLPVEALVNRITAWFVPVVLVIATLAFAIWWALAGLGPAVVAGVSVLIIACPCAMGLATPMSIMVGTGRAAELGVLFHKGAALQRLQDARVIAFDKTGTLTVGTPAVTDMAAGDPKGMLRLAAGVEQHSEHPIARAIIAAAEAVPSDAADFAATPGQGATATVEGKHVVIGNPDMLAQAGIRPSKTWLAQSQNWSETGATPIHVAVDGVHVGVIAVSDQIRTGAAQTIARIRATGRTVAMISGDAQSTADHVAGQLGIDTVVGNVRPDGKVAALEGLRAEYGPVAFVGDGINDAPALAAADVGLAVNGANDAAIEAADVVMMSPEPGAVLRALDISAATLRNIRQNLGWAFGYNALLIPVAAGLLVPFGGPQLSPPLAALAMALSSVFVVTNALRLRGKGQT
ncbi:heavy metal translocating P-type ATPase [uncultured Tateyamaria sp.]|uniref:heavy metal translocating P-type ATPase n=1 Tax=uncultured Tateyamaria sp. TaxID=455651 RepID=UPI00261D74B6|nr:heavy metal translocating P-type ATPase [uncultured Tateyamaria sp.]